MNLYIPKEEDRPVGCTGNQLENVNNFVPLGA